MTSNKSAIIINFTCNNNNNDKDKDNDNNNSNGNNNNINVSNYISRRITLNSALH